MQNVALKNIILPNSPFIPVSRKGEEKQIRSAYIERLVPPWSC